MSTVNNKFITHEAAVPVIESEVFRGHEDQRFALGVLNTDDVLSYKQDSLEQAYLQLRANVYFDQTKTIDEQFKRVDGTEIDENDERSTHFVVLENIMGKTAVFACMRLIEKGPDGFNLPSEDIFPEAFLEPAVQKSVEVSRFIARHKDPRISMIAQKNLIASALSHTINNDLGPAYGIVEPLLANYIDKLMKVPVTSFSEIKKLPEYNDDENLVIEINTKDFAERVGSEKVKELNIPVGTFRYWGNAALKETVSRSER